jgi:coenzyme F420-reducing hydrogenase delta subunit
LLPNVTRRFFKLERFKSMKNLIKIILSAAILRLIGCEINKIKPFNLKTDSIYLSGNIDKALILAHGRGKHPKWKVVNPVRKVVNKKLGWHTFSLQMPVINSNDFEQYVFEFDEAYERIQQAINYLKAKGVRTIVLFGHSMGSRMMSAFVRENPKLADGLIVAGCRNYGDYPMNCHHHLGAIKDLKVLDMYGGGDVKDSNSAKDRSHLISGRYTQKSIKNANHKFDGYYPELTKIVADWLSKNF